MTEKKRLPAEMYDKVNYMCRRYMDRIARFELDYDVIPDIEAFKRAVTGFFEAAPVFHSRFIDNHIVPFWKVSDYTVDDILTVESTNDLAKSADEFLLRDIDLKSNVQMKIGIFTNNGRCKICFMWNHMCMDGGDLKQFLDDFFASYNACLGGDEQPMKYKSGGTRGYKAVYADFDKKDRKKAKSLFAGVSSGDRKHHLPFTDKSAEDKKFIARRKISADIFNAARITAKNRGATVNDLLAAAYIKAFYAMAKCPRERVGISCAVDLRRYIKNLRATGYTNHTTFFPCVVQSDSVTMTEMLDKVVLYMKKMKEDRFLGLHGLPLLHIGYSTMIYAQAELVVGMFYNNANLAISNVGAFNVDNLLIGKNKPVGAAVAGAAKEKPCAMTTALTLGGELSLSICSRGNKKDAEMLDEFLRLIEKNLSELAEA